MDIKLLNEYPLHPMDKDSVYLMLQLSRANDAQAQALWEKLDKRTPAANLLAGRLGDATASIDRRVLTFVASLIDRPGAAVLWAHTLLVLSRKHALEFYSWAAFISEFAMGLPNEKSMEAAWDAQKTSSGNYLDTQEAWQWHS